MSVHRDLHQLIDDALAPTAAAAIVAVRQLQGEHLEWLERRAVALARAEGMSWAGIGRMLGRSRQAMRQRYAADPTLEEVRAPRVGRHVAQRIQDEHDAFAAELRRARDRRTILDDDEAIPW